MGYILFSSEANIFIMASKTWDGTIEYSYNNTKWVEWNGETIVNNNIYMRGVNNTVVSCGNSWIINGKNVKCQGNIENLLDYKLVINNIHPKMKQYCFSCMFDDCKELIDAPQLFSLKLTVCCYMRMFCGCTSLSVSPCFSNFEIAKEAIINQHILDDCPIRQININNKLYDINVLKLL